MTVKVSGAWTQNKMSKSQCKACWRLQLGLVRTFQLRLNKNLVLCGFTKHLTKQAFFNSMQSGFLIRSLTIDRTTYGIELHCILLVCLFYVRLSTKWDTEENFCRVLAKILPGTSRRFQINEGVMKHPALTI